MRFNPRLESASILVIALWTLCFLSSFAVILGANVRQKVTLVQRLEERERLRLVLASGLRSAVVQWVAQADEKYTSLKDMYSYAQQVAQISIGEDLCTIGATHAGLKTGAIEFVPGVVDEERKINLNTADRKVLAKLFMHILGIPEMEAQDFAGAFIDWRDADEESSASSSAEGPYYRGLPSPYEPKNAFFELPDELLLVKGVTPAVFVQIRPYVTVFGTGKVNINTASTVVLQSLGLSDLMVAKIIEFRGGKDGVEGTSDDGIFEKRDSIVALMAPFFKEQQIELDQLEEIAGSLLTTVSDYFSIEAEAGLMHKRITAEGRCVFSREGTILYWRES